MKIANPNLSMVRSLQEIEEGSEMAVRVKEAWRIQV